MIAICLLLWLGVFAGAHVSSPQAPATPIVAAGGAFFALSVPDVQASGRWYSEKLGLRVVMQHLA